MAITLKNWVYNSEADYPLYSRRREDFVHKRTNVDIIRENDTSY